MGILLAYSIKSSICLTLFYLFYKVLLSKETFHRSNRIILLGLIGLAISIPFLVTYSIHPIPSTSPHYTTTELGGTEILPANPSDNELTPQNDWAAFALVIYIAGICICLLRNIAGIMRVLWIIRKGKRIAYTNNVQLIVHNDNRIAPFSWMKFIVISQSDMDEAGETILLHEQAHIRHRHTIDLFLAELCIILQWYNPGAWLLHRELQAIHEYEADETVINQGIEAKQYQLLLIKKAVGSRLYSMANSFNHSNLKKRITMMLQKKSSSWARLKYAYILPLATITLVAFARPEISQPFEEISSVKVSHFMVTTQPAEASNVLNEIVQPAEIVNEIIQPTPVAQDDSVYNVVEVMPQFPGGQEALMDFIAKNIVYPKNMENNGVQGIVVVSYTIMSDGEIRDIKIVRSLHPEADAEAIRVVKAMPKWTPGKIKGKAVNVRYTVPLTFRLQN